MKKNNHLKKSVWSSGRSSENFILWTALKRMTWNKCRFAKKKHLSRNDIRIVQKGKDIYLKEIWPPPGWWSWWWPSWWRRAGWRTWWIWGQTRSGAACSALQCRSQTWNSAVWRMRTWRWHQIRKYFVNNWCIEKTTNLASWADLEKPLEANSRSIIIFGSGRDMAMLRKRT